MTFLSQLTLGPPDELDCAHKLQCSCLCVGNKMAAVMMLQWERQNSSLCCELLQEFNSSSRYSSVPLQELKLHNHAEAVLL